MANVLVIGEQWKPIPDFPGYEVSNQGRVRSFKRQQVRMLAIRVRWDKALDVHLCHKGVLSRHLVHRLVLSAFVGPCPPNSEALHRNGIKSDNTLVNLHWGTRSENHKDRTRLGEWPDQTGRKNPNYKHGQCCDLKHSWTTPAYRAYHAAKERERRRRLKGSK